MRIKLTRQKMALAWRVWREYAGAALDATFDAVLYNVEYKLVKAADGTDWIEARLPLKTLPTLALKEDSQPRAVVNHKGDSIW